mmetsp:Transcript_25263/g.52572  ORF Transcript_25263/g.52572 Transcript_25263/m.52572 type:complete len:111 (+) Transcript_25263:1535-1867(+)
MARWIASLLVTEEAPKNEILSSATESNHKLYYPYRTRERERKKGLTARSLNPEFLHKPTLGKHITLATQERHPEETTRNEKKIPSTLLARTTIIPRLFSPQGHKAARNAK